MQLAIFFAILAITLFRDVKVRNRAQFGDLITNKAMSISAHNFARFFAPYKDKELKLYIYQPRDGYHFRALTGSVARHLVLHGFDLPGKENPKGKVKIFTNKKQNHDFCLQSKIICTYKEQPEVGDFVVVSSPWTATITSEKREELLSDARYELVFDSKEARRLDKKIGYSVFKKIR